MLALIPAGYPHAHAVIHGMHLKVASTIVTRGWLRLEVIDRKGRAHVVSLGKQGEVTMTDKTRAALRSSWR